MSSGAEPRIKVWGDQIQEISKKKKFSVNIHTI